MVDTNRQAGVQEIEITPGSVLASRAALWQSAVEAAEHWIEDNRETIEAGGTGDLESLVRSIILSQVREGR